MGSSAGNPSSAGGVPPALPLFYRQPELLSAEQHAGKSIARAVDFRFARATNSVPLNGVEFALAQRHYPIVFTSSDPVVPAAVLGLRDQQNRFVSAEGCWAPGHYIPAYIRRYPFVFVAAPGEETFGLCLDMASEFVVDGTDNPLFTSGQPTELTKNALAFCAAYQAEYAVTRKFCAALVEQNLFDTRSADIRLADGQKLMLGTFRVISEERFNALPDATILDWRKRGWLAWIYAHLMSFASWGGLTA